MTLIAPEITVTIKPKTIFKFANNTLNIINKNTNSLMNQYNSSKPTDKTIESNKLNHQIKHLDKNTDIQPDKTKAKNVFNSLPNNNVQILGSSPPIELKIYCINTRGIENKLTN